MHNIVTHLSAVRCIDLHQSNLSHLQVNIKSGTHATKQFIYMGWGVVYRVELVLLMQTFILTNCIIFVVVAISHRQGGASDIQLYSCSGSLTVNLGVRTCVGH